MARFEPPVVQEGSDDPFFGRYLTNVGQSVVKSNGHYTTTPYPWLGELVDLTDGVDYFLGGHVYEIPDSIASELVADGYQVGYGYGLGGYGEGFYGGSE